LRWHIHSSGPPAGPVPGADVRVVRGDAIAGALVARLTLRADETGLALAEVVAIAHPVAAARGRVVNGRDKLSQKWSFKSEPLWKGCRINSKVLNLIPC